MIQTQSCCCRWVGSLDLATKEKIPAMKSSGGVSGEGIVPFLEIGYMHMVQDGEYFTVCVKYNAVLLEPDPVLEGSDAGVKPEQMMRPTSPGTRFRPYLKSWPRSKEVGPSIPCEDGSHHIVT